MDLVRRVPQALVAAAIGSAAACAELAFACEDDGDCEIAGGSGTCEGSGFCSFPDEGCASGARYGGHAGDGLAGECVDAASESSSSSSGDAIPTTTLATTIATTLDPSTLTDDPSGSSSSSEDSSSSDEGNEPDTDDCGSDCVRPGEVIWSVVDDDSPGDGAGSIALLPAGTIVVGAGTSMEDGRHVLQARALTPDGDPVWMQSYDTTPLVAGTVAHAWGLAIDDEGRIAIGGTLDADEPRWVAHGLLAVDGTALWSFDAPGGCNEVRLDADGRTWALTEHGGDAAIVVLAEGEVAGEFPSSWFPATALPRDLSLVAGGWISVGTLDGFVIDDGYAASSADGAGSLALLNPGASFSTAYALAPKGDAYVVVGAISVGLPMGEVQGDGWIGRYDGVDATATVALAGDGLDALHDVAIAPDGDVIAVGWQADEAEASRIVAMRFDSELALRWQSTIEAGANGSDRAYAVTIGDGGELYVAGVADLGATSTPWIARLAP